MGEQTVTSAEVLHDSKSELQELGVSAERAAEACRSIWRQQTLAAAARSILTPCAGLRPNDR